MGLFSFGKQSASKTINWQPVESVEDLERMLNSSGEKPVLLFKHSTRCSISAMALHSLENNWELEEADVTPAFIDLIRFRDVSNKTEELTGVLHQSPQAIVIKNGTVVYQASHNGIKASQIKKALFS